MSRPAVLPWRSKKPMPRYSTLSSHPARYHILCAAISDVQAWLGLCKIVGQALSPPWGLGLAWLGLSPGLLGVNLNFVDSKLYIALKVVGMDILIRSRITWARLVTTIHFNCEIHSHCASLWGDDNRCSHQPQFLHVLKNILNVSMQHQRLKGRLVLPTDTFCICNISSHCCSRHTFWGEGGRTPSHLEYEYDLHTVLCCLRQWSTNWYPSEIHSGQWSMVLSDTIWIWSDVWARGTQDIILKHRVRKLQQGLWGPHPPKSGTLTLIIFYKWKYKKIHLYTCPFSGFPSSPRAESSVFATSIIAKPPTIRYSC